MATQNAVGNGLAGATGSGNFVGANTPTLITPVLGAATGTSLNFGASTTNGLIGVTGASLAASGVVGEVISSAVADSTINLTSNTATNITSITLTAGDWDVTGWINYAVAGGTTITGIYAAINTTSATFPSTSSPVIGSSFNKIFATFTTGFAQTLVAGNAIINVNSNTTVYLVGGLIFGVSTATAGGVITARRRR